MYDLDGVNKTATAFLEELERGTTAYREEQTEICHINASTLVVLKRPDTPPYFYGFKPSGRPIFTHDIRLAKAFKMTCHTLYQHAERLMHLGVDVDTHPTVWFEGRHKDEHI